MSFGQPHYHEADFIALAAYSFVSKVKKRCRNEAGPILSLYDDDLGALLNADRGDSVEKKRSDRLPHSILQVYAVPETREDDTQTTHNTWGSFHKET